MRRKPRRRRRTYRRNPLSRWELLEGRQMLAADLGQIAGTVLNDLDNGLGADIVAVGQQVELFLDDGDGVFNAADVSQGTTTTDSAGEYSFDDLAAGTYFVQIAPSTGTQTRPGEDVSGPIVFTPAQAEGTTNITIDDFGAAQTLADASLGSSSSGTVDAAGIAGGEQDLFAEVTAGAGTIGVQSGFDNTFSTVLNLESSSGVNGRFIATYDGDDNDATTLSQGLSLDLLQGGLNSAFALNLATDQTAGTLLLRIHSGAGNFSTATVELNNLDGGTDDGTSDDVDTDGTIDGDLQEQVSVSFTDFVTTSGTGADFENVTALELELDFTGAGENGLDAQIEVLGVVGFTTQTADFTVLNELSLGDQVFLDLDNDGVLDAGEAGIAGVAVTLFEDSNGDNSIAGEAVVATTTTDADGNYLFTGLLPGDYLVQIDAANFTGAGALVGLQSSTGNDPALDPDVNALNGLDRGTTQGDGSVLALGVTLVGNAEPIDDGDTDPNTNLTLDFGFFGFDLVIDKSVDQLTAGPNDPLVYTITVTNNGPTNAAGVTVADTLPTGVTFVSATSSQGTATGTAGDSLVSADLGLLAPGASATITVNATIDALAAGVLLNTATVSAPNESNTGNNTATATTTVVPEVDLALTKVDDDNDLPVIVGQTITYTVTASNNGPSDATGVIVTDVLPTGLTFVPTGSTAPTSVTPVAGGTELTFNLGDLAAGATAPVITILATVDAAAPSVITNTASVAANETETNPANNTDSAQSALQLGSITGQVFIDANANNERDPNELPIQGVVLSLFNSAGALVATTTTDANGEYTFTDLPPDTYQVVQTQPSLFPTIGESSDTDGAVVGVSNVISNLVVNGDIAEGNDFGEGVAQFGKRSFFYSTGLFN